MNIFVIGGAKSGKSMFAQRLAKKMAYEEGRSLYYVATMIPYDDEDKARIVRHRKEREGWGFETIEWGRDIERLIYMKDFDRDGVFLIDSVTALVGNEIFDENWNLIEGAGAKAAAGLLRFAEGTGNTVFVSDFLHGDTYEGSGKYDFSTEEYMKSLAYAGRQLADVCDKVYRLNAGIAEEWK